MKSYESLIEDLTEINQNSAIYDKWMELPELVEEEVKKIFPMNKIPKSLEYQIDSLKEKFNVAFEELKCTTERAIECIQEMDGLDE